MAQKVRINLYLHENYANLLKSWCNDHPRTTYGEFIERLLFKAFSTKGTATGAPQTKHNPAPREEPPQRPGQEATSHPNQLFSMPMPKPRINNKPTEEPAIRNDLPGRTVDPITGEVHYAHGKSLKRNAAQYQ